MFWRKSKLKKSEFEMSTKWKGYQIDFRMKTYDSKNDDDEMQMEI